MLACHSVLSSVLKHISVENRHAQHAGTGPIRSDISTRELRAYLDCPSTCRTNQNNKNVCVWKADVWRKKDTCLQPCNPMKARHGGRELQRIDCNFLQLFPQKSERTCRKESSEVSGRFREGDNVRSTSVRLFHWRSACPPMNLLYD